MTQIPNRSLIQILRSTNFALGIAILSVIVQSFHSFTAFYNVSSLRGTAWGVAQAVCFAIIIDLAILFYTVRKNVKVTWMAGFIMVLINCYYYYSHLGISFDLILGGLLSLVIPVSVYFYSEEIEEPITHEVDYESEEMSMLRLERDKWKEASEASERFTRSEQTKSMKYITELREEIRLRDDQLNELHIKLETEGHSLDAVKYATGFIPQQPQTKGFASLKSPAQEGDKSLLNVMPNTDRPIRE